MSDFLTGIAFFLIIEGLVYALAPLVLVEMAILKLKEGGRLFYIGAGTSGRLGILDASECPPTFGVSHDLVNGIIAGGDQAIRKAVEFAEDSHEQAWNDLQNQFIDKGDVVIGIGASGTTPYVVHGLKACKENQIVTACITSNPGSPVTQYADYNIPVEVGPEFRHLCDWDNDVC